MIQVEEKGKFMSAGKKIVVGLDIGTTKIACLVGTKNEHGKITAFANRSFCVAPHRLR